MSRFQANLVLLVVAMIWGGGFVVQQIGVGSLGTIGFTGARFLLGALVVAPFALRQYFQEAKNSSFSGVAGWLLLVLVGCVLFTAAGLQQYGILHTSVTNSGFLTGLYVPLVPLLSLLLFRKAVHPVVWPASLFCFLGIWLLGGAQQESLAKGDWWVIASSFFWALHVIIVGSAAKHTGMPLVVAAAQFAVCGILGIIAGIFFEGAGVSHFASAWKGICYSGIFSVGLAFTLQVVGQRYTAATDAAIILSAETVFAALAGIIFLGERLGLVQFAGAMLIFSSVISVEVLPLVVRRRRKSF